MPQIQFRDFLGGNIDAVDGAIESALTDTRELVLNLHPPSPELPEILFLPGLPGSLLDTANRSPVWVGIQRILDCTIGTDLDPGPAGSAASHVGAETAPSGPDAAVGPVPGTPLAMSAHVRPQVLRRHSPSRPGQSWGQLWETAPLLRTCIFQPDGVARSRSCLC